MRNITKEEKLHVARLAAEYKRLKAAYEAAAKAGDFGRVELAYEALRTVAEETEDFRPFPEVVELLNAVNATVEDILEKFYSDEK